MIWRSLKFDTSSTEVYHPKPATLLLEEEASKIVKPKESFLEIGTGSGAVAITVAKFVKGAKVTASDISKEAIKVSEINAKLNNVKIETIVGDLFKPFKENSFDVIATHPPAVPYPSQKTWGLTKGMTIATNGGDDGSKLTVKSIYQAVKYLKPKGKLLLLLPHWSNTKKAYETLLENYSTVRKISEKKVQFFPMDDGKPTKELMAYVSNLVKNGVIELFLQNKKLYSRVSVIEATK